MEIELAEASAKLVEQQAEIERLRADLAHADAKGQENDKLLWGTIKANERLRKMLWEVNEQCPEHVPVSLLNQIRAALEGK
jgi:hypothetical protein